MYDVGTPAPWSKLDKLADDILRQVVCDCGNYRHHGVDWMPEGSGEGRSVAKTLITKFIEENIMARVDPQQSVMETAGEEKRAGCTDMAPRNRRDDVRLSDIHRAVDKVVPLPTQSSNGLVEPRMSILHIGEPDPELLTALAKARQQAEDITGAKSVGQTQTLSYKTTMLDAFDKNSSGSLKLLRWEIYDLIERYEGDYGRTISHTLKQEVEDLFKKYTHS